MTIRYRTMSATMAFAAMLPGAIAATNPGLPDTMAVSAYEVGSGGYNQAVAIGAAFKNSFGVNLRVIPGKNDVSRVLPLATGKIDFVINGVGTYMAQEGLYEFGARDWGPLPTRILLANSSGQAMTMIVAADTGVKTVADMKGKRISWVIGAPGLNQNLTAVLAFAGLSWKDVEKIDFGSSRAGLDALTNDLSDAGFSTSVSGYSYALEKSPRGLVYPSMPASDTEGWKRVRAVAPYMVPTRATDGAGVSKERPVETSTYPYPILTTYADRNADVVYAMMQAMTEAFPAYKDAAPGNSGWGLDRQNLEWVVPYHDGAIRYFREKGMWTNAHQKHNDALIQRQKVLAAAWKKLSAQNLEGTAHMAAWQKARADALKEAGLPVVVERW